MICAQLFGRGSQRCEFFDSSLSVVSAAFLARKRLPEHVCRCCCTEVLQFDKCAAFRHAEFDSKKHNLDDLQFFLGETIPRNGYTDSVKHRYCSCRSFKAKPGTSYRAAALAMEQRPSCAQIDVQMHAVPKT